MVGYCYSTSNEYIILKLIKFVKLKKINYSIYDLYMVTEKQLDFKDFGFKASKYYLKFIGMAEETQWLNNGWRADFDRIDEVYKYCFRLKKDDGKLFLYIKNKKYYMPYSLDLLRYFYRRKEEVFFEKDYHLTFLEDGMEFKDIKPEEGISLPAFVKDPSEEYEVLLGDLTDRENEGITEEDRKTQGIVEVDFKPSPEDESFLDLSSNLDFEVFYKYYFKVLTLNQKKICALLLLGIRITDISRLMETTQVYITLEVRRIAKKIRKLYKKIGKEFYTCQ